jgi:transmembrane sensor
MYMPDNRIKELLRKYLNGTATPEETKLVDDWYSSLSGEDKIDRLSDVDRTRLRNEYWEGIKSRMKRSSSKQKTLWVGWMALAAAVSGIVVLVYFFLPSFQKLDSSGPFSEVSEANAFTESIKNSTDEAREITLPDSSRVTLFPGSALGIHDAFNTNSRTVSLSGRAFFDVSRDESRPFFVLTNEVVTKVLGTSFTVSAFPGDREITVAVTSGKVSVYAEMDENKVASENIILKPNQQAVYNKSERKVARTLVSVPKVVIPEEEVKKIRFEGMPVSEIFKALEKMYGVDIEFDEKSFRNCSMTTSVSKGELYDKIDVICEITGASYSLEDARIRISGSGCN